MYISAANHVTFAGIQPSIMRHTEAVAAARVFQNSILTEFAGAAFAFLTLAYIVISLARM